MTTDDLIKLLATEARPVPRHAAAHYLGLALAVGLALASALLVLGYGIRPDLAEVANLPMFWVKLLGPAFISGAAWLATQRLARPGVPAGRTGLGVLLPVAALWVLAAVVWQDTPAPERPDLLWGSTWATCTVSIALFSLPTFAMTLLALRSLAPTQARAAGAAAGALAGGLGAAVYALHCQELEAPFLAVWYVAGMAIPVLAGALLGPRWLRW